MKSHILVGVTGLVLGLAIGFFASNSVNRHADADVPVQAGQVAPPPSGGISMPADGSLPDVSATIDKAEREPQNFAAQMKAGDMYGQIGRYERAIEYYQRGVVLLPKNFSANVVLANALFDASRFEEASVYYSRALEIDPKDVNARTDLGTTFVERAAPDYDRAIQEFTTVLAANPKQEQARYSMGVAMFRKGDVEQAKKILDQLEANNPNGDLPSRLRQLIVSKK